MQRLLCPEVPTHPAARPPAHLPTRNAQPCTQQTPHPPAPTSSAEAGAGAASSAARAQVATARAARCPGCCRGCRPASALLLLVLLGRASSWEWEQGRVRGRVRSSAGLPLAPLPPAQPQTHHRERTFPRLHCSLQPGTRLEGSGGGLQPHCGRQRDCAGCTAPPSGCKLLRLIPPCLICNRVKIEWKCGLLSIPSWSGLTVCTAPAVHAGQAQMSLFYLFLCVLMPG